MKKVIIASTSLLMAMIMSLACTLISYIYGWGLQPQSWPIIIGCWLVSFVAATINALIQEILKDK